MALTLPNISHNPLSTAPPQRRSSLATPQTEPQRDFRQALSRIKNTDKSLEKQPSLRNRFGDPTPHSPPSYDNDRELKANPVNQNAPPAPPRRPPADKPDTAKPKPDNAAQGPTAPLASDALPAMQPPESDPASATFLAPPSAEIADLDPDLPQPAADPIAQISTAEQSSGTPRTAVLNPVVTPDQQITLTPPQTHDVAAETLNHPTQTTTQHGADDDNPTAPEPTVPSETQVTAAPNDPAADLTAVLKTLNQHSDATTKPLTHPAIKQPSPVSDQSQDQAQTPTPAPAHDPAAKHQDANANQNHQNEPNGQQPALQSPNLTSSNPSEPTHNPVSSPSLAAVDHQAHNAASIAPDRTNTASQTANAQAPAQSTYGDQAATNLGRVIRGLGGAVQQNGGSVTIRLTPPDMGVVRVQMAIEHGFVRAQINAETESARQLLTSQIGQLRQTLQGHGLGVEKLDVGPLPQNPANSDQALSRDAQDRPDRGNTPTGDGRSRGFTGHQDQPNPHDQHPGRHPGQDHEENQPFWNRWTQAMRQFSESFQENQRNTTQATTRRI